MAEYVLPKFNAAMESSTNYSLDDKKVSFVIRAKYTNGKPLKGKVIITVSEKQIVRKGFGCHQWDSSSQNLVKRSLNIVGSADIELDMVKDLKFDHWETNKDFKEKIFEINVEVTEHLTGLSQTAKETIKIHKSKYIINVDLKRNFLLRESVHNALVRLICFQIKKRK